MASLDQTMYLFLIMILGSYSYTYISKREFREDLKYIRGRVDKIYHTLKGSSCDDEEG
jgi:hypothetical protein